MGALGLQQGDSFLLYLFDLCLEILSPVLQRVTRPDFYYHPKCAAIGITHLAYVDVLLFARWEV